LIKSFLRIYYISLEVVNIFVCGIGENGEMGKAYFYAYSINIKYLFVGCCRGTI